MTRMPVKDALYKVVLEAVQRMHSSITNFDAANPKLTGPEPRTSLEELVITRSRYYTVYALTCGSCTDSDIKKLTGGNDLDLYLMRSELANDFKICLDDFDGISADDIDKFITLITRIDYPVEMTDSLYRELVKNAHCIRIKGGWIIRIQYAFIGKDDPVFVPDECNP